MVTRCISSLSGGEVPPGNAMDSGDDADDDVWTVYQPPRATHSLQVETVRGNFSI